MSQNKHEQAKFMIPFLQGNLTPVDGKCNVLSFNINNRGARCD